MEQVGYLAHGRMRRKETAWSRRVVCAGMQAWTAAVRKARLGTAPVW
jgi:hypothetical protein